MEESPYPALYISPSPPCPEDINTPTTFTMNNSIATDIEVQEVKFFPPLHEQRRSWALEILRRERVTKVVSLGREIAPWVPTDCCIILTGVGCRLW